MLMSLLFDYAAYEGVEEIYGLVQADNMPMLAMAKSLGLSERTFDGDVAIRRIVWRPRIQ